MNRILFYPCAGTDWKDAFLYFSEEVDEFVFCDIKYKFNFENLKRYSIRDKKYEDVSFTLKPAMKLVDHTSNFENIKFVPAEYTKLVKHKISNKTKKIIFKMESGQNCLDNFNDQEIYVFFHRGDSTGEGGSDLHFFTNKRNCDGTAENLYSRLLKKLAPISYVVSDGSNNDVIKNQELNLKDMTDEQIQNEIIGRNFIHDNLDWTCIKRLNDKYGPTLVWKVIKK